MKNKMSKETFCTLLRILKRSVAQKELFLQAFETANLYIEADDDYFDLCDEIADVLTDEAYTDFEMFEQQSLIDWWLYQGENDDYIYQSLEGKAYRLVTPEKLYDFLQHADEKGVFLL